jgi:hypothetical protein
LSAKMANKNVNLSVDDENKNSNGYCFVKSISVAE